MTIVLFYVRLIKAKRYMIFLLMHIESCSLHNVLDLQLPMQ